MLSFSTTWRGFPASFFGAGPFFGAGSFFCFFALGGVFDRSEPSCRELPSPRELSSSLSGLRRFLGAVLIFKAVCTSFLGAAFEVAAFFGAGLALAFYFLLARHSPGETLFALMLS